MNNEAKKYIQDKGYSNPIIRSERIGEKNGIVKLNHIRMAEVMTDFSRSSNLSLLEGLREDVIKIRSRWNKNTDSHYLAATTAIDEVLRRINQQIARLK